MDNEQTNRYLPYIIGAVVLVLILLCSGGSWFLVQRSLADDVRDFLIILLAVESMIVGGLLILMLIQLYQLIMLLRKEVIPLLNSTKETVEQVKHTTTFVGQSVAAPIISLTGLLTGAKAMVNALRGKQEPHQLLERKKSDG
ncbi:MAG: hypothetical protein H0T73_23235 [Ardenticatenales bacterium]|nr:hypothetical protein [Ardenticatenales bacterium]